MSLPPLWPHQHKAIASARDAFRAKHRRVVLQVPTGGGKTRLAVEVVRGAIEKGSRVLWLAHRTELISQAFAALTSAGLDPGCIAAGMWSRPDLALQVASIQTLAARGERPPADLVVADECHHLGDGAETWRAVADVYPRILGLTATPERGDGTGLAPMFTHLIQVVSVRDLTESGHLVPAQVIRPDTYLKKRGATGNVLAQPPVEAWMQHAGDGQGFLFAATVDDANEYADALTARGITARCVHAGTPVDERAAMVDGFRAGRIRVLTNVYVFTEGTDLPMARVCMLARGCSTAGMMLQMIGRVLRLWSGKRDALVIDLPGITHLHGMPEDERVWQLDGRACIRAAKACPVCKKPWESPPCSTCGYQPEAAGEGVAVETSIVNAKLALAERLLARSPEQQQQMLTRWLVEAAHKGRSPGSVVGRWAAVHGVPLSWKWYGAALHALCSDADPKVATWATMAKRRGAQKAQETRRANADAIGAKLAHELGEE